MKNLVWQKSFEVEEQLISVRYDTYVCEGLKSVIGFFYWKVTVTFERVDLGEWRGKGGAANLLNE